ncbi:MAG: hypothetical protein ACAH80_05545 [Alphaproteobacteria bacterium]
MLKLSPVEENIFDDLVQDAHELWEWYSFFRYTYPDLSEDEIISAGHDLLSKWIEREWLDALKSREDERIVEGKELLSLIDKLGSQAADPKKGVILLYLTAQALSDIGNAPSMEVGKHYTNPKNPGESVRTQSGFATANNPLRRGPYAKWSKDGHITYEPLEGNPLINENNGSKG